MDSAMWDGRYGEADLVWSAEPNVFLPPLVRTMPRGTALDVASGEGRNAIWLAQNGWDVTAFDFSPVGIDKARTLSGATDVHWEVADATTYVANQRFDLVVMFYLHLPQDQLAEAVGRALDAVAPGGTFFAVGHAQRNLTDGYGGPPIPEILWEAGWFAPLLANLDTIELGERVRAVPDANAVAIDVVAHAQRPDQHQSTKTKTTPAE